MTYLEKVLIYDKIQIFENHRICSTQIVMEWHEEFLKKYEDEHLDKTQWYVKEGI